MTVQEEKRSDSTVPKTTAVTRGERLAAQKAAKAARKAAKKGSSPLVLDSFTEKAIQTTSWVKANQTRIWIVGLVAVIAVVVVFSVRMHTSKRNQEAGKLLGKAVSTATAEVLSEDNASLNKTDVSGETYASKEEKTAQTLESFLNVSKQYPNTTASLWSEIGAANTYLVLDKLVEAKKHYKRVVELADDDFLKYRALEGVGFVEEAQKKYSDAITSFKEIARIADGAYKPESNFHVARMYFAQNNQEKAVQSLRELLKEVKKREADQRGDHRYVKAEAENLMLELGYDPDEEVKAKAEEESKPPSDGKKSKERVKKSESSSTQGSSSK